VGDSLFLTPPTGGAFGVMGKLATLRGLETENANLDINVAALSVTTIAMKKTYLISDETFKEIVREANSIADILRAIGLRVQHGPSYHVIRKRIARLGLSIDHFDPKRYREAALRTVLRPLDQVLVKNSKTGSPQLRARLIKENILEYKCVKCDNTGEWQGKPLQLQLDHINGDHKDNRLTNLRILCPNCHTQTETHSGKNRAKHYSCPDCGRKVSSHAGRCRKCARKLLKGKPNWESSALWPADEELKQMVWTMTIKEIAKSLNISDVAVHKRCKLRGIVKPPAGYWSKRKAGQTHEEALTPKPPKRVLKIMTPEQVELALQRLGEGRSCRKIGRELGFHHSTISALKRGEINKVAEPTEFESAQDLTITA
jgi:5-methylcytosine-specific restriction endonuclease McrA